MCLFFLFCFLGQGENIKLAAALVIINLITTIAYVLKRDPIIFFSVYSILTLLVVVFGLRAMYQYGASASRTIGVTAVCSYGFGFCLWAFENNNCPTVVEIRHAMGPVLGVLSQLHAWWHLLAAVGGYLLVVALLHVRLTLQSTSPRLVLQYSLLPMIDSASVAKGDEPSLYRHGTLEV